MMDAILLHAMWWLIGFCCGMVVMAALSLSSSISRTEDAHAYAIALDEPESEPETVTVERIQLDENTAQMVATAKFYQELFAEEMMRNSGIKMK